MDKNECRKKISVFLWGKIKTSIRICILLPYIVLLGSIEILKNYDIAMEVSVKKRIQREKRKTHLGSVEGLYLLKMVLCLVIISSVCWAGYDSGQDAQTLDQTALGKFRLAKVLFYKGERLFNKGDEKKAEKVLNECLENFPDYAFAHFYLSRIAYNQKDFPKALAYIESAKKAHKIFADLSASTYQEYIDLLREQKANIEQQIFALKEKLPTVTTFAAAADNRTAFEHAIGSLEVNLGQINNRLITPITQLAEIPADYYYIHGNILFKMNKFQEAFDQYMQTVTTDPKHSNALGNLANLFFMSEQYQNALNYLDKAESCGSKPNPQFRAAILEALKE